MEVKASMKMWKYENVEMMETIIRSFNSKP